VEEIVLYNFVGILISSKVKKGLSWKPQLATAVIYGYVDRVETKTPSFIFPKSKNKQKFAWFLQNFAKILIFVKVFAKSCCFCESFHTKYLFLPVFFQIFLCPRSLPTKTNFFQMIFR
jgi:hypothetical protein